MSTPTFTTGPWGIFASSKERGTQVRASMGNGHFNTICYALHGDADGRLIAAAPEMYEALETLLATHKPGRGQCCEAADKAIDALAKARGEEVSA